MDKKDIKTIVFDFDGTIADKLNLSVSTISKHVYQIYKKCKVNTNMELLKLFLE